MALAALVLCAAPARAIISADVRPDTGSPVIINTHVGADRFYGAGYFGQTVAIANVESGHVWTGHEALQRDFVASLLGGPVNYFVQDASITAAFPQRQYDWHATAVGSVLSGLGPPVTVQVPQPDGTVRDEQRFYLHQFGMAPLSTLFSTAIATDWVGHDGEFNISQQSFLYGYRTTMQTGVEVAREIFPGVVVTFNQRADVVNTSWGFEDPASRGYETQVIDALTYGNKTTVVMAAGNHDTTANQPVVGPASSFNGIAVGALTGDLTHPPYGTMADFSNGAPNDFFNPQTGQTTLAVRPAVDITAPGTDLFLAAYTGETGTNPLINDPYPGEKDLYWVGLAGTSFASPIVAGGAALLIDAANYQLASPNATDARVIKAVLLNSADKTPGWTNHTVLDNGVLTTPQGLDFAAGAGMLNLNTAYDQFLSGTTDVAGLRGGVIGRLGWDFGEVVEGTPNDYFISGSLFAGDRFTATLDWFVYRSLDANDIVYDREFDALALQLWLMDNGHFSRLIAQSDSPYNNVQHLFLTLPESGLYGLRVAWNGVIYDTMGDQLHRASYGLAWSVTPTPEPLTGLLALLATAALACHVRRRSDR